MKACDRFVYAYFRQVPVGAGGGAVWRSPGQDSAASCLCLFCKYDPAKMPVALSVFVLNLDSQTYPYGI